MAKYRICERFGCHNVFDYTDHKHQRFCSKSCAKIGTRHRHEGAEAERPGQLAAAVAAVRGGLSCRQAAKQFNIPPATVALEVKRLKETA